MKYVSPVLTGLATTFITGLILFPLVYLIFDNFFQLYIFTELPPNAWIDDAIVLVTASVWILFSAAAGAYVCVRMSEKKEDFTVFLFGIVAVLIAAIVFKGQLLTTELWILIAIFTAGAVFGGWWGMRYKKKRALKEPLPNTPRGGAAAQ